MHTFRACRGRFGVFFGVRAPFQTDCGVYSPGPLNTRRPSCPGIGAASNAGTVPERHRGDGRPWPSTIAFGSCRDAVQTGQSYSPYSCIPALEGERSEKRGGSEYAEYTEYKFENPYGSRAEGADLYAFGI